MDVAPEDKVADDEDRIAIAAHFVDGHNIRVSQLSRGAGFAKEELLLFRAKLTFTRNL